MPSERRDHLQRLRSFPSDNLLRSLASLCQVLPKSAIHTKGEALKLPGIYAIKPSGRNKLFSGSASALSRHLHETSRRQFPDNPGFPTVCVFLRPVLPAPGDKGMSAERHPCDNSCSCFNYLPCGMRLLGVPRTLGGSFTIAFKEGPIARPVRSKSIRNTNRPSFLKSSAGLNLNRSRSVP